MYCYNYLQVEWSYYLLEVALDNSSISFTDLVLDKSYWDRSNIFCLFHLKLYLSTAKVMWKWLIILLQFYLEKPPRGKLPVRCAHFLKHSMTNAILEPAEEEEGTQRYLNEHMFMKGMCQMRGSMQSRLGHATY